jgi:hypothetical protein
MHVFFCYYPTDEKCPCHKVAFVKPKEEEACVNAAIKHESPDPSHPPDTMLPREHVVCWLTCRAALTILFFLREGIF